MPDTLQRADPPTETNHRLLGKLTEQPWWTQADQAELDALLGEWVDGMLEHKERCTICSNGDVCDNVLDAWLIVWEFREQRIRVSKAQWLRVCNDTTLKART